MPIISFSVTENNVNSGDTVTLQSTTHPESNGILCYEIPEDTSLIFVTVTEIEEGNEPMNEEELADHNLTQDEQELMAAGKLIFGKIELNSNTVNVAFEATESITFNLAAYIKGQKNKQKIFPINLNA
jgi:hypothetical protein